MTISTSILLTSSAEDVFSTKLTNFELVGRLLSTEFDDDITVDSLVGTIAAGAGNDVIRATDEAVSVFGDTSDDLFVSGSRNDTAEFYENRGNYTI